MVNKRDKKLSVVQQCILLNVSRSGLYYERRGESERNLDVMKAIDRIHTDYPFYGFRRIRNELRKHRIFVSKKNSNQINEVDGDRGNLSETKHIPTE
jgi:putative transposase